MKSLIALLFSVAPLFVQAQSYAPAKTNWQEAGYKGTKPSFSTTVNVINYGADPTGIQPCGAALTAAINALSGKPGIVYFPAGTYFFNTSMFVNRDSIIFRGAGYDSTQLKFDLAGQLTNLVNINGTASADTTAVTTTATRGAYSITVADPSAFRPSDWVTLSMNDQAYMASAWAYGSLSQIMQVKSINGNAITFSSPFRFNYLAANSPVIRRILPRNNVGIECLKIQRLDVTAGQASNIAYDRAVNCWVAGIESDIANFAHIEINHSSNIEVTNSYFHDAFSYGGNGKAYGVLLQFGSNECRVESNYFNHLRHSMVLQAGANGNVLAYNYSTKPFWTEPSLPDSSAGEIVLHGNFPFMNLAEGNFVHNIVIDDSHGKNGTLNTFFRNRAEGYGIFMNFNPATDSVQFIGNEITNTQIGMNLLQGKGHFLYDNNYRGTITDIAAGIPESSLYLPSVRKPDCGNGYDAWPVVGRVNGYNSGTIYAKARVLLGKPAACDCITIPVAPLAVPNATSPGWDVYPNPANEYFEISGNKTVLQAVEIFDKRGVMVISQTHPGSRINIGHLSPGMYTVRILSPQGSVVKKLIKSR